MNSSEISHRVKEELAEALLLSVIAKNQEEIDRGTLVILHHQAQKGYIIYLLHFINQNLPSVSNLQIEILVSSSFAQLKVLARNHWFQSEHEKNMTIPPQDKQYFLNSVIQTAFNIGSVDTHRLKYKYMKLFKDVLELICAQSIIIAPQLIESIKISLQSKTMYFVLPVYLNILLAFNNNMSLYLNGKYFEQYLQITKQFHAIMYQFVQDGSAEIQSLYEEIEANISNQELLQVKLQQYNLFKRNYEQILYLCIKYIYKSARKADKLRSIVLDWIPIAIERIEFIDQAFTKESNHSESFSKSMGEKGNDEFNYFHSKKWALKLLDISIDKILVYSAEDNHAFHQVNLFYYKNCNQIIALFKNIWNYLWPERITFQLLVCFENFIRKKPQKLAEQQQSLLLKYQRQILLPFMYINSKQISILQQNPSQFIVRQGLIKFANGFVSYRVAAFNIWISIANIEKYYCQSTCNKGKYLKSSLHLLKQWLQVFDYSRLQLRDTACLLLIKLAEYYSVTHLREQLYVLVNNVIQHNMQNLTGQHYMLAVRTLQLIKIADRRLYPALIPQSRSLIITIFNGYTQQSLLSNSSIFVLVRTSEAYFKMMTLTKEHDLEEAKYVCMKILKLVKKTCVQNFIKQANSLLKHILHKERNFARDVLIEIKGWVRDFMEKDIYSFKNDLATEYKQNFSECAKGTQFMLLNLMNYVRQGQPQITELLQQQIIAILQYYFSSSETDPQNRDDGLELLEKFLFDNFNRATVSPQIIKLCRYIVIKLSGVPPKIITRLKRDPSSIICEQNNHVLYYQCEQQCLYGLKNYHSIMKSFIRFFNYGQPIRPIKDINNTLLQPSTNNAQLIIYLAYKFFSPKEGSDTLRQGKCFSLLMLIYYYEHHQRKDCTQRIHQSIHQFTFNVIQLSFGSYQTNPIFVKYTSQLFALWINQLKEGSFKYLSTIKKEDLAKFLNNVFLFNGGEQIKILREFQQKSRLVCGICQLFRLTLSNPALWQYLTFQTLSQLMQILITMMSEQMQQITISSSDKQVNQPHQAYQQQLYQNFIEQKQDSSIKDDEQEDYQFQATSNTDNSFNFEEDLSLMESLPYDAETDCMILLTTLYQLYTHNQQLYWKMIDEIDCNDDICTILQGSGCFDEESKYYLKVLCKMEEWTEETD